MLRYGIMAGAGIVRPFDVTNILFMGFSAAALHAAAHRPGHRRSRPERFPGQVLRPRDQHGRPPHRRIPAVAAALGLSIGLMLSAPAIPLFALALNAMSVTAVMSAVYAAVYQPGNRPKTAPPSWRGATSCRA